MALPHYQAGGVLNSHVKVEGFKGLVWWEAQGQVTGTNKGCMKDRVCTLSVRKKTSTVKIRTSSERNKVRKREFFFFNKNRTVKRQWRPSRRLVRVCDGLAARGCACPALGVLPEGCVEIASNSYALKLRVLVGAVVCSPDVCSQLCWQPEEQAHRRGYSAEGYGPGVNLVGNQGGERSANPVTIGRKAQAEAFEK